MRDRVSLYIYENGRILFFNRLKEGRNYHVAIGGGVELGETVRQAAHREAKEETNYDIVLGAQLWVRELQNDHREYAYLVTKFSGTLALGGPELERQSATNQHIFQWIPLLELPKLALFPGPLGFTEMSILHEALSCS
ncbi:MAG: NUDIX domain-containing protein [Chloroflexi bacterium]|nr:NUDIX domain-containing protein [Chloroflexota bacterium]